MLTNYTRSDSERDADKEAMQQMFDLPVVPVLAKMGEDVNGQSVPAFGLEELSDEIHNCLLEAEQRAILSAKKVRISETMLESFLFSFQN